MSTRRLRNASLATFIVLFTAASLATTLPAATANHNSDHFFDEREYYGNGPPIVAMNGLPDCQEPTFFGGAVSCTAGGFAMADVTVQDAATYACAVAQWYDSGTLQGTKVVQAFVMTPIPIDADTDEIRVTTGPVAVLLYAETSECTTPAAKGVIAFDWHK